MKLGLGNCVAVNETKEKRYSTICFGDCHIRHAPLLALRYSFAFTDSIRWLRITDMCVCVRVRAYVCI